MAKDPSVSAVVHLGRAPGAPEPPEGSPAITRQDIYKAKGHFTSAGFEVHAPLASSFSIGGPKSLFERVFGERLKIDEDSLGGPVTTEDGGLELPLAGLPEEIGTTVRRVCFTAPPPLLLLS